MENHETAHWLRVTGQRLKPMNSFLNRVAELIDSGKTLGKEAATEVNEKLHTISEFLILSRDEAEQGDLPDAKEALALIHAMVYLMPNVVTPNFNKEPQGIGA